MTVKGFPPNYKEIAARLKPTDNTVFAYDGVIYVPSGGSLPYHLVIHEHVHFKQQKEIGGAEKWWERYMEDPEFRLEQELEAYRAQYHSLRSRGERRILAHKFASDLASPMYGSLLSKKEALALIIRV